MTELWREIRACRFVLAELSGRNPNVLYEVGLAHAIGKPVISITRTKEDVPFDVRDLRYFFYDVNHPKWGETLQNALTRMASAIIKDPAFGDYLEGIRSEGRMVLPKALPKERIQSRPKNTQRSDISGTWTGTYTDENRVSHSLALELVQSENSVKGFALVTYSVGAVKTTVQEDLKGFVNEREVSIQGVGYSYLERGASVNYVLDNFTLKLKENNKSMKGHAMYGNHPYPVEFIKQR
jgi:hypothetical protein